MGLAAGGVIPGLDAEPRSPSRGRWCAIVATSMSSAGQEGAASWWRGAYASDELIAEAAPACGSVRALWRGAGSAAVKAHWSGDLRGKIDAGSHRNALN